MASAFNHRIRPAWYRFTFDVCMNIAFKIIIKTGSIPRPLIIFNRVLLMPNRRPPAEICRITVARGDIEIESRRSNL